MIPGYWIPAAASTTAPSGVLGESVDDSVLRFSSDPIMAWRVWYINPPRPGKKRERNLSLLPELQLCSSNKHYRWPARKTMRAHCANAFGHPTDRQKFADKSHAAPELSCTCGIYALKEHSGCGRWGSAGQAPIAYGQVILWGRILEFAAGYRAEFAYPAELWVVPLSEGQRERTGLDEADVAQLLSRLYAIPAHVGLPS